MKQHIMPVQLNELSEKNLKKLQEWWKPQKGDLHTKLPIFDRAIIFSYSDGMIGDNNYPLLSIGQMIQFLDENTKYEFHIFRRMVDWKIIYEEMQYGKILGQELCYSLWDAIKESL